MNSLSLNKSRARVAKYNSPRRRANLFALGVIDRNRISP